MDRSTRDSVFWKGVAERRLASARSRFLANAEKFEFLRKRMEEAEKLLVSESPSAALLIFSRFRAIFRGTAELEPWLEYARYRNDLQPAEMPVQQKVTEPGA